VGGRLFNSRTAGREIDTSREIIREGSARASRCREDYRTAQFRPIDEWHLDLEKLITVGNLGSHLTCPASSKKADLRAIRPIDRSNALWRDSLISILIAPTLVPVW
jgi:hypothetical protein